MKRGLCLLIAATFLPLLGSSGAGEIVTKTYYNSKGEPVKGYVYSAGKTRRTYERRSNRIYLPFGYGCGYGYGSYRYSSVRRYATRRPVYRPSGGGLYVRPGCFTVRPSPIGLRRR